MIVAKGNLKGKLNIGKEYVQPITQQKTVTPTEQIQEVLPDINVDALSKVTVNAIPEEYLRPDEVDYLKITETDQEGNEYLCYLYKPAYSAEAIAEAEAIINGDGLLIQVLGFLAQPDPNNLANLPYIFEMIGIERVEKLFQLSRLVDTYIIAAPSLHSIGFVELSDYHAGENGFFIANARYTAIVTIEEDAQTGEKSVNIGETQQFISPEGTTQITENGTYDVREFESAEINVGGSGKWVVPNGMKFGNSTLIEFPELDTSNVSVFTNMFQGCANLQTIILDGSSAQTFNGTFLYCSELVTVSIEGDGQPTDAGNMFGECSKLENIPMIDTSKIVRNTGMVNMFASCGNLSNESLNKILLMCANSGVTKTSSKRLSYIGLSQAQATTCTTLSNWQTCVSAGWSTGY